VPIKVSDGGTVLNASAYELPSSRGVLAEFEPIHYEISDTLPAVPALTETLLALELMLQGSSADLGDVSETLKSDMGATIQVLRLAGREYGDAEDRPVRIEDCISDLGARACLSAAAKGAMARGPRRRAVLEMWSHSREIAGYCRMLAEETPRIIAPHEAYLAGLLHAIGALPAVLGWERPETWKNHSLAALRMAELWSLPVFLKDFFCETHMPGYDSSWSKMLATAHDLAMDSRTRCPLANNRVHRCAQGPAC
jgi:hypothetical protein